ncbi:MAG TPA: response regulator, partial [Polyangiaceae bacterium]|nr:response regulator [Polyangiaceae bacterium]
AILVVDDSPGNLIAFEASLKSLAQPIVTATCAEEALRELLSQDIAVAVLDVQMPGTSGFELAAMIRSHSRLAHVPIIFVTASSRDYAQIFAGYAAGAVDYLLKPFEPEILRAKIRVFLELHLREKQVREQAARLHQHEIRELERRGQERVQRLSESLPLPVWGVRPDGRVHVCNSAWTTYSGATAEQTDLLVSQRWVHPIDFDSVKATWEVGIRSGQPFEVQCRLRGRTEGMHRWFVLRAVPEAGRAEPHGFWIVAGVDVDAQKTAEEERARLLRREQHAREAAEAANRTKDEFLATISHELRTPLNAILGWARMMRGGILDAKRMAHAVETIERNAKAQASLINDILDVSRIVSGKMRLQVGPLDLPAVVGDAVQTLRPAAEAKAIDLQCESSLSQAPMAGDPLRMQQIVWNLVSNAVKFTPRGGRVDVRLEREGDYARLVVRDTGPGIAPEILPYVFDRFRQGDATASRTHEGLGLGLSIVKHLVELHGGEVLARSEGVGKGAEFVVSLPLGAREPERLEAPQAPIFRVEERANRVRGTQPRLDGATVLFVDDRPEARALADALFERYGATVVSVESAEQALSALKALVPDVLISDVGMPGQDGYALIRSVRRLPLSGGGNVPAIALTAYARAEDALRAKEAGFHVHLPKPVDPDELVELVANLIAGEARIDGPVRGSGIFSPPRSERGHAGSAD